MAKGTRASGVTNEPATSEVEYLRDMMQNFITKVGALAGKISFLEKLDEIMIDLGSIIGIIHHWKLRKHLSKKLN